MSGIRGSILFVSTALSLGLGGSVGVRAADAVVAASDADIEQVVVTARRREELLQDVPISITVFNQQQLSNHNVVNAQDLATYTPSLGVNNEFGSQNSTFALRGFVQDIGTAPSVGVFFADVVSPRAPSQGLVAGDGAGPGDFFDLQNVQVLKGPQGTLFGRNTTGGDILLVPQKPTDEFGGYIEGSFGNYDMRGGQGVINIPVNDDVRLRLGIDHESRDGYLNSTSGIGPSDFNDVDYTALRASADIDITPDLENYTIATYTNSQTHGSFMKMIACDSNESDSVTYKWIFPLLGNACNQLTPGKPGFQGSGFYDGSQTVPDAHTDIAQWRVIDTTTWHESDTVTFKNIASYAQLRYDVASSIFGTNFHTASSPSYPFNFAWALNPPGVPFADQATYTEEFQAQGDSFDDRLTWQAGGYLEGDDPVSLGGSRSPVVADCVNPATFKCYDPVGMLLAKFGEVPNGTPVGSLSDTVGKTFDNDYAIYGQATYKLLDELKLTGGYRYTWDREANISTETTPHPNYPVNLALGTPNPPGIVSYNCTNPLAPGYLSTPLGYGAGPVPNGACTLVTEVRSNAPTWLLDLDYTPTDDILAYIKWARGYRQGVLSANIAAPFNLTQPEKVDDYEGGVKTSFDVDGVAGTFDVDGFYNDFRNQQIQLGLDANPCYQMVGTTCIPAPVAPNETPLNAGKSRIAGMELDTSIVPYQGVTLQVGYTYLYTELLQVRTFVLPEGSLYVPAGSQRVGDPLPLSPRDKVSFTGSYVVPVDESIGKITVSTTFTHTDRQLTNYADRFVPYFANLSYIQPTNLLDLNLNWDQVMGKPFDLSVFATNVTGDKYYSYISGSAPGTGFETAAVGQPTFYGVRLRIHFGGD